MEVNEIIECYNTLSDYAKRRVATLVKDLHSDRKNTETTASEYDQLIEDTFTRVPLKKTAETLSISIYIAWRMRMKLLHALGQIQMETVQ